MYRSFANGVGSCNARVLTAAPELGQHTMESLTQKLGYTAAEAKALIAEGVTFEANVQSKM